jgi:hypothetical protein
MTRRHGRTSADAPYTINNLTQFLIWLQFRIVKFLFDRSFTTRSFAGVLGTLIYRLMERDREEEH